MPRNLERRIVKIIKYFHFCTSDEKQALDLELINGIRDLLIFPPGQSSLGAEQTAALHHPAADLRPGERTHVPPDEPLHPVPHTEGLMASVETVPGEGSHSGIHPTARRPDVDDSQPVASLGCGGVCGRL